MYRSFYQLQRKPFQITTDPDFLWLGEKHREALATLTYGVMENKGFLLLTGDVGTGKTTLINALVNSLDERVRWAMIADPGLSRFDFYQMVNHGFGLPGDIRNKSDFLMRFGRFLHEAHSAQRAVLLIIDETQRLKHDLLEEIRLLSNIEKTDAKLLTIFFVGQNEVNALLREPENRALRKRISITYHLEPLNRAETHRYIRHRLNTAGAVRDIFSSGAVTEVFNHSGGSPRQINIICDLALLYGFEASTQTVNRRIVRQCLEKIHIPRETGPAPASSARKTAVAAPAVPVDRTDRTTAVLKWAVGGIVMMLVIVSVALFFPRRLDNAGPSASSSVMPAPIPATIVQVPVIADAPPVQRRTTVTATLAMPAESAPAPRPLHADAPVAPGQPPSTSHPPSVQAIVPLDGADVQPAPVTASSAADAESPPTAAAPMQGTMVSPSSPPSASTSMADGRNATKTPAIASDTPTAAKEPDPGDIIDWLMKKKPAPGGSRTHDGAP